MLKNAICIILIIILPVCFTKNLFAKDFKLSKTIKTLGVILVEGYPTCNSVRSNQSIPADPSLIYDGSQQILNIHYYKTDAGIFGQDKWEDKNPDSIKYGFKAVKIDANYFDAVPPVYKYPMDVFTQIKNTILEAILEKRKYLVKFVNGEVNLFSYLNRPVSNLISDIFIKGQIDAILIVNYTATKSIWKTRSITTGGYRYSWPYTEDGLNLDLTFSLYLPNDIEKPSIRRKTIEVEKKKMNDEKVVEKTMKELNKKIKHLF